MSKNDLLKQYKDAVIQGDITKYTSLSLELMPKKLYHYCSFSEHWHSKIICGQIFLNNPVNFNDPYDCRIQGNVEFWLDSFLKDHPQYNNPNSKQDFLSGKIVFTLDEQKVPIREWAEQSCNELKSHFKIACFSEIKDSMLMWSHYANMHRGYVIEIDTKKLKKNVYDRVHLKKVIYQKDPVTMYAMCQAVTKEAFLLCKAPDWKYEKEWRFIEFEKDFLDISEYISAIYLGARFDFKQYYFEFTTLQNFCKSRGIKFYQMKINDQKYQLDSIDISNAVLSQDGNLIL